MQDDDAPAAVQAATVGVKTLADGTLRLTVEIEPRHALNACRMFLTPGVPVAVARLDATAALTADRVQPAPPPAPTPPSDPPDDRKGGALAQLAGRWCADREFQNWLFVRHRNVAEAAAVRCNHEPSDAELAAMVVRELCGVASRADLDFLDSARRRFDELVRHPYMAHMKAVGP